MKKLVLGVLAVATLASCKKNETTEVNSSTDSSMSMAPTDSEMVPMDSTAIVSSDNANLTDQDKKFADKAATGGMMEVTLGQMAETNATNDKVKALAKMIVDDHTKANNELKSWATSAGYTLPTNMMADQQKMVDDLKAKKGADFDKAYTDMMVTDHKKDIALFKDQASMGGDANLKSFASKTLPALEQHLAKAEEAKNALK